MHTTIGVGLVV